MHQIMILYFLAVALIGSCLADSTNLGYWESIDTPEQDWWNVGGSNSGQYIFASSIHVGSVYLSKDFSKSWQVSNFPILHYTAIVCNNNCSIVYVLAAEPDTSVIVSYDLGNSWKNLTANGVHPSQNMQSIACSFTGQYITVSGFGTNIYSSTDFGKHWTNANFASTSWGDAFVSKYGDYFFMSAYDKGIWYSTDHGSVWQPANSDDMYVPSVTASSDGKLVYTVDSITKNAVYKSTNYGVSFTRLPNGPNTTLVIIRCNDDCSLIMAASNNLGNSQYIYQSTDYGASWNLTINSNYTCDSMYISSSGQLSVCASYYYQAGVYHTGLYSYQPPCDPGVVHSGFVVSTGMNLWFYYFYI